MPVGFGFASLAVRNDEVATSSGSTTCYSTTWWSSDARLPKCSLERVHYGPAWRIVNSEGQVLVGCLISFFQAWERSCGRPRVGM